MSINKSLTNKLSDKQQYIHRHAPALLRLDVIKGSSDGSLDPRSSPHSHFITLELVHAHDCLPHTGKRWQAGSIPFGTDEHDHHR